MNTQEREYDELDRDLWVRKTKLMFPEVEDFVIEMAVDAWLKNEGKSFELNEETKEEARKYKQGMFEGLSYNGYE